MTAFARQEGGLPSTPHRRASSRALVGLSRTERKRTQVAERYRRRPPAIRNAIARSGDLAVAHGLGPTTQRILIAIIATCVDAEDALQVMFARKATLAKAADCSEATFYRSYAELRKRQILVVNNQERHADGSMAITTFTLSQEAALALGFPVADSLPPEAADALQDAPHDPPPAASNIEPSVDDSGAGLRAGPNVDPAFGPGLPVSQSFGEHSAAHDAPPPERYARRDGMTLPAELLDLVDTHKLSPRAVCSLMRTVKDLSGGQHQLGDVYRVLAGTMRKHGLVGNNCYAYIAKCARSDKDWTRLRQQLDKASAQSAKDRWADRFARSLVDQWFRSARTGELMRVEEGAEGLIRLHPIAGGWCRTLNTAATEELHQALKARKLVRYDPESEE